jgi:hypothetical protein
MARDMKLVAVLGGGLAVGVGAIVAFKVFGQKAVDLDVAKKQVTAWSATWHHARDCYLGAPRAARDPADALAIRALTGDAGACAPLVARLGRPAGVDTGIDEVEVAFAHVELAARDLARAAADPEVKGKAIARVEAAAAELRKAAGLDPEPAPAGLVPADAQLGPPAAGTAGIRISGATVRDHVIDGHAVIGDRPYELVARAPDQVRLIRNPVDTVRAVPDLSWAAVSERGDDGQVTISAGPVGASGEVGDQATVVVRGEHVAPLGAVGTGPKRMVLVRMDENNPLAVVASADGGATWTPPVKVPIDVDVAVASDPVTGAVDLLVPSWRWIHVVDAALPKDLTGRDLPDLDRPGDLCLAGGAAWYGTAYGRAVYRVDADHVGAIEADGPTEIRACTRDAAAVVVGVTLHRCGAGSCDEGMTLPSPHALGMNGVIDVFDGSGAIYAQQDGRVVAVWRTGVEPLFVRVPAGAHLAAVASWGPRQYLALSGADGLRFAPIP